MKIPGKAVITALDQLIRHSAHEIINAFSIFLFAVNNFALVYASFVFVVDGILGISFVKGNFIKVEYICLASTFLCINFTRALGAMPQEKFFNEPATAERLDESNTNKH